MTRKEEIAACQHEWKRNGKTPAGDHLKRCKFCHTSRRDYEASPARHNRRRGEPGDLLDMPKRKVVTKFDPRDTSHVSALLGRKFDPLYYLSVMPSLGTPLADVDRGWTAVGGRSLRSGE